MARTCAMARPAEKPSGGASTGTAAGGRIAEIATMSAISTTMIVPREPRVLFMMPMITHGLSPRKGYNGRRHGDPQEPQERGGHPLRGAAVPGHRLLGGEDRPAQGDAPRQAPRLPEGEGVRADARRQGGSGPGGFQRPPHAV